MKKKKRKYIIIYKTQNVGFSHPMNFPKEVTNGTNRKASKR